MSLVDINPAPDRARPSILLAIAASFTAQPVEDALAFWMEHLALPASIEFAPYGQIYQQLLDPGSLLSRNRRGVNIILLRPEDWLRELPESARADEKQVGAALERNVTDFVAAMRTASAQSEVPFLIVLSPASPTAGAAGLDRTYVDLSQALRELPGVAVVAQEDLDLYSVADYSDPRSDRLGHVPYTPEFFAALATILARRVHAYLAPPHKVVVLDCDNTLWQGVVGEDGVDGIAIPAPFKALQRFMVELSERGFLLCLCSKNVEADVLQVFEQRPDMILRKEHLVSWRVNWQAKGENIRSLAQELNLGLDSFVFLDDNPLECAEVELSCPGIVALRLPDAGELEEFLRHLWALDRVQVTAEDQQRTAMYQQEAERARFQRTASTLTDFLTGLALNVVIAPPVPEQVSRVAQLTQRTNQFNFTTVRRTDGDIRRLDESALECRVVEVSDRFGDYGLVGVMIFGAQDKALVVDSFLLSCRVLGRGVEHQMMRELGAIAQQRGLARVTTTVLFTKKNQPAREFLEQVGREHGVKIEGGVRYELPAQAAATLTHQPETMRAVDADEANDEGVVTATISDEGDSRKSRRYTRIATELAVPQHVLAAIRTGAAHKMPLDRDAPVVAPRTELESTLVDIWSKLLRVSPIGIRDDFFHLGGDSLQSVGLCAEIEQRLGKAIPLTSIMEAPTIEALAARIETEGAGESLVVIRPGAGRPPIFLVHDGDGETLLYRNLAMRLDERHAVYGLQPFSVERARLAHTRIPDMAAHFITTIRTVQPRGPYLMGGMCAGGVIAFEMARQLRALGEQVAMIALLDAADTRAMPRAWKSTQERWRRSLGAVREAPRTSPVRRALAIAGKLRRKGQNLATYLVRDYSRGAWDWMRLSLFRTFQERGRRPPTVIGPVSVRAAYLFAERYYRPDTPFDGELVLFRATQGTDIDEPYVERYEDPLLGWGPRATRGVRAIDVPGGHSSMLQEPNVDILAKQFQNAIEGALDESGPLRGAARIA